MRKIVIIFFTVFIFFDAYSFRHRVQDVQLLRKARTDRTINRLLNRIFDAKSCNHLRDPFGIEIDSKAFRRKSVSEKTEFLRAGHNFACSFYFLPRKKRDVACLISTCIEQDSIEYNLLRERCYQGLYKLFDDIEDLKTYKIVERFMSEHAKREAYQIWSQTYVEFLRLSDLFCIYGLCKYFESDLDDSIKFDLTLFFENFKRVDDDLDRTSFTNLELELDRRIVDKYVYQSLKIATYLWNKLKEHFADEDAETLESRINDMNRLTMLEGSACCCSGCC